VRVGRRDYRKERVQRKVDGRGGEGEVKRKSPARALEWEDHRIK